MEIAQTIEEWAYRLTDGTPLDGVPTGYAQALGWLGHLDVERPTPSVYDRWALGAIVAVLRGLPDGTRHAAAGKAIAAAKILRGPRTPGRVLEDLALIGVLAPADRPGLAERFTSYVERDLRPSGRVEVQAPLAWWSTSVGDHGVRRDVWDQLFVGLEIPEVDLDGPRPTPTPTAKETLDGALAARVRAFTPKEPKGVPSTGDGPVAPGDVWAVRLDPDRWMNVPVSAWILTAGSPCMSTTCVRLTGALMRWLSTSLACSNGSPLLPRSATRFSLAPMDAGRPGCTRLRRPRGFAVSPKRRPHRSVKARSLNVPRGGRRTICDTSPAGASHSADRAGTPSFVRGGTT